MAVVVTDWRCSSGACNGAALARRVSLDAGWIERKCRKCGRIAHVGERRGGEQVVMLKCGGESGHRHILAQASATWTGSVTIYCERCKHEHTLTPASS